MQCVCERERERACGVCVCVFCLSVSVCVIATLPHFFSWETCEEIGFSVHTILVGCVTLTETASVLKRFLATRLSRAAVGRSQRRLCRTSHEWFDSRAYTETQLCINRVVHKQSRASTKRESCIHQNTVVYPSKHSCASTETELFINRVVHPPNQSRASTKTE